MILVPGNAWTGAHSWMQNWYGTSNSVALLNIKDPKDNFLIEIHQYFDPDFSGTSADCKDDDIGVKSMTPVTNWLRKNHLKGFLAEFGASTQSNSMSAMDKTLKYMEENHDVWFGWTYWAAGPWWHDYMYSVEPVNNVEKQQMTVLQKYLAPPSD